MIEIRTALPDEVARQRELWQLAFGDSDTYLDYVYDHMDLGEILVLLDDGKVESMTILYPVSLSLPDGTTATSAYVYALATHPDVRKKGYARMLLNYVDFYLQERKLDSVTIVPAEPSLHRYFDTVGFQSCFSTRKIELLADMIPPVAANATIEPIGAEEYLTLRTQLLAGTFHVSYREDLLAYQGGLSQMLSGDLYRLTIGDVVGVCAAERHSAETILTKELLLPPKHMLQGAALLAKVFPAHHYHLRTPACWEGIPGSYIQEFGMVKWYNAALLANWRTMRQGYLGLAFD